MKNNKNKKSENLADILIEELKTPIIKLNNMQSEKLKFIKSEVNFIIKNDVNDKKRIEKTFDMFLDLAYWFGDQIEKEYYDLLEYYKEIDFDVAKDYERFYLKIINEEE